MEYLDSDKYDVPPPRTDEMALLHNEVVSGLGEKMWVGTDVTCSLGDEVVRPKHTTPMALHIPKGYLNELGINKKDELDFLRYLLKTQQFTTRSILTQAGLVPTPTDAVLPLDSLLQTADERSYHLLCGMNNRNTETTYTIPHGTQCMRLMILPKAPLAVAEFPQQLHRFLPQNADPLDRSVVLPLGRIGVFEGRGNVDISKLTRERDGLDNALGIKWHPRSDQTAYSQMRHESEWVLGETADHITVPEGYAAVITPYDRQKVNATSTIHSNSVLIDSEYSGRVRTEYETVGDKRVITETISMSVYRV